MPRQLLVPTLLLALALGACGQDPIAAPASNAEPDEDMGDMQQAALDLGDDQGEQTQPEDMSHDRGGDLPSKPEMGQPEPICEMEDGAIRCPRSTVSIPLGVVGVDRRDVHWQLPQGLAPARGWPVVILFQGSLFSSEFAWVGEEGSPYGGYHQLRLIRDLLHAGFAVLTPEARFNGSTFWDTNIAPFNIAWTTSTDHDLMQELFDRIEGGDFGELDPDRLYATGISSGGYMTSRMALAYPGRFNALAIQSASYATCSGALCFVGSIPDDHPPTLFLHGSVDLIVPQWTMELYYDDLREDGHVAQKVIDPSAGHEWLEQAPEAILMWFQSN